MTGNIKKALDRLSKSKFRRSKKLNKQEIKILKEKGLKILKIHAYEILKKRLFVSYPKNDGKQTPWHGYPIFPAQHATATCCRKCLEKWHNISQGRPLNPTEQKFIINLIIEWLKQNYESEKEC